MMFCSGMCRWRPAGGWQGTGATLVATNAATQLSRLSRTPKQNYIFSHYILLQKCSLNQKKRIIHIFDTVNPIIHFLAGKGAGVRRVLEHLYFIRNKKNPEITNSHDVYFRVMVLIFPSCVCARHCGLLHFMVSRTE